MRLKAWHCLTLLSGVVLAVYYPSLYAGYNSVDDLKMISDNDGAGPLDLWRLFFPQGTSYYYRPLTILTYLFDRDAWGTIASFMHLENVLLHLGCTLLVFAITRRIACFCNLAGNGVALFAALLFAFHPLATESVCWISGRTDPLSGFFLLLAVWLTVIGLQARSPLAVLFSGVALLLACLAKEVAVFILPGLLWLVVVFPERGVTLLRRLLRRWLEIGTPVAAIVTYFVMRHFAIARDTGINTAMEGVASADYNLLNKVRVALKVYGFYFKKLFIPWPLNFGIIEVSGWYVLAGGVLALLLFWLFMRADLLGAFGLIAFCVLSPALLVPFGKMAWTPIAERYLYTSIALSAPPLAILIFLWRVRLEAVRLRRCDYALTALLLVFFATTLHRAWIWQDNLRLYTDTAAKSPGFLPAKVELASALLYKGRTAESEAVLVAMKNDSGADGLLVGDLNLAQRLMERGELENARRILIDRLDKNHKQYHDLLQALLKINDLRFGKETDPLTKLAIQQESLSWLIEQQRICPAAFTLYRIGKQQLALGDRNEALKTFRAALAQSPADAHYRGAAEKFIERLEGS